MLVVKTYLGESPGKGIGLFAGEPIQQGQEVWVFHPSIDLLFAENDVPQEAREFFDTYAIEYEPGNYMVHVDNARFINHSEEPNIVHLGGFYPSVASRDIAADEEITVAYETIDIHGVDF